MDSWKEFFVFLLFLVLIVQFSFSRVDAVNDNIVALEIAEAEENLCSAYVAVLEAEEAGANVSRLLVRLNLGGEYLAEAYICYRIGLFENASHYASLCHDVVGDMSREAFGLKSEAHGLWVLDFIVKFVWSAGGVIVVLIVGLVVWSIFRRHYIRRILGLKPEVISGES